MNARAAGRGAGDVRGFTLVELMVVVAVVAIASAMTMLAMRDPQATRLDHEAARLVALLEAARTEARARGLAVRWDPHPAPDVGADYRFVGLPPSSELPQRWLEPGVGAEVVGGGDVELGPEPMIGPQRIVLGLGTQRVTIATDGLDPFAVVESAAVADAS